MGMIGFSLILLFIGLMIKADSKGSVFYRGTRIGRNGKPFRIFKFRTMVVDAEKKGGQSTAMNDPRLTKVGKVLRKYKLDELPQLINVFAGEMSLVGPRPQVEKYTSLYNAEEKEILSVRPGLTDYASIRFVHLDKLLGDEEVDRRYREEIEPEKNKLRLKYVRERCFLVDLKILIFTVFRLLRIRSLWNT
jgi:lipopolysaccharide/colanic/teichoic acid biosynthesis glycosyltransferase